MQQETLNYFLTVQQEILNYVDIQEHLGFCNFSNIYRKILAKLLTVCVWGVIIWQCVCGVGEIGRGEKFTDPGDKSWWISI